MNSTLRIIVLYLQVCFIFNFTSAGQPINSSNFPNPPCWQYSITNPSKQQIASDNIENIYLIRDNKFIDSINTSNESDKKNGSSENNENNRNKANNGRDGRINWTFDAGGVVTPEIIVNNEFVYVLNSVRVINDDGNKVNLRKRIFILRSIGKNSGLTAWKIEINFNFVAGSGKDSVDRIGTENNIENIRIRDAKGGLLLNSNSCLIYVNKSDGSIKWEKCIADGFSGETVFSDIFGDAFAFFHGAYLYFISLETGEVISKIYSEQQITAAASLDRSAFIYGDKKGSIRSVSPESGKVFWAVKTGGEISGITETAKGLLAASFDNFVYMFDKRSGRRIWKKRFAGRIKKKPFVKDNTAIIVSGDKNAFFIDIANGDVFNQISLPDENFFLSAPISVDKKYYFLTNKGVMVFTEGVCS